MQRESGTNVAGEHAYDSRTGGSGRLTEPLLLDLDNNGLSLTDQSATTTWFDMAGDGKQHQTAWAGKGDGVLAIDANGDGEITERNEIVFTDWEAGSSSDMEALRHVFDTNHNGTLDAGDARFGDFRVVVDGQVKTLSQLNITAIDLTPKGTGITYADGSGITATTTFTRGDGSTGTVGDAVLLSDANGYRLNRTVTTLGDGSTVIDTREIAEDGSIVTETKSTMNAAGTQ